MIAYDPRTRESVVLSAWGDRVDWYRDSRIGAPLEVLTTGDRYVPAQRLWIPASCTCTCRATCTATRGCRLR